MLRSRSPSPWLRAGLSGALFGEYQSMVTGWSGGLEVSLAGERPAEIQFKLEPLE